LCSSNGGGEAQAEDGTASPVTTRAAASTFKRMKNLRLE
jgi:hypothetical protein